MVRWTFNNVLLMTLLMAFTLAWSSGCEQTASSSQGGTARYKGPGPYAAVVTTAMIADIVRNVAGDRAQVRSLMGAGVDPHLYRATRDDMTALLNADIVFYNGLNLEGKMSDVFIKVASAGKPVHAVTELLDEGYLLEPAEFGGHYDPHIWMDPNGWIKATEAAIVKLAEFDPPYAERYRA